MIKHEIFDLAALRAAELSTVADGAVFLHRDQLCTKFTINGNKAWATLSGHMAPRVAEWRNPSGRIALVRAPVCIRFVPRSEIHHGSVDNPLAHALVLERGIGIGASGSSDQGAYYEPGRMAIYPGNPEAEFHDNAFRYSCANWEMQWLDSSGFAYLVIARLPQ